MDISEINQLKLLKNKTPAERFLMMTRLIHSQRNAMEAGIRHLHPSFSEKDLRKCLRTKMMQIYSSRH